MKVRACHVSNSSCASFVADTYYLSKYEINHILNYENSKGEEYTDSWDIEKIENKIYGTTIMDNGDLAKYLGVELANKLHWESF